MSERLLKKGDVLYRAGEKSDVVYLIVNGRIRIALNLRGKVLEIDAGPGDFIGDSALIFGVAEADQSYRGTATAVTDVTVSPIPLEVMKAEVEDASPLLRAWIASFVDRAFRVIDAAGEA